MSDSVRQSVTVAISRAEAFTLFVARIGTWWPRAYTWSREVLRDFGVEPRIGGLCYEIGPGGFRCDWGTVLRWDPPGEITLAWQISARREPEPNPSRASRVQVRFAGERDATVVSLVHDGFENHGDGAEEYRAAMASAEGWPYILQQFARAALDSRAHRP